MPIPQLLARRGVVAAIGIGAVVLVGVVFAFEPVTRRISIDSWCTYCHLAQEYSATSRLAVSKPHPIEPVEGKAAATCIDCHLPEGFSYAVYAYTHYVSATDLFGHFRDRDGERSGAWIPASAARAYRVRDRLLEYDSNTCRTCHIESEIKPKRKRGERAHQKAIDKKQTCMECHDNLVHRFVASRSSPADEEEAESTAPGDSQAPADPFATDSFGGEQAADPFAAESFDAPQNAGEAAAKPKDEFEESFDNSDFEEPAP